MTNTICLDNKYSTTQLLTHEKPILENKTEDKFETILFLSENEDLKGEGGLRTKGYFKKSYEKKPLISIITVVFNGEKHLEQTIQSVINQTYDNVEYIIIDGGSNDGTVDIIKKYEDMIDYWVSEKDDGIYDAMNKGLLLARGDYIAYLNADDWYKDSTLLLVQLAIHDNPNIDYFFGNVDLHEGSVKVDVLKPNMKNYRKSMPFGHPTLFVKNTKIKNLKFHTKYKIIADYDLALRLIENKYTYFYIADLHVGFRLGGVSKISKALKYEHFKLYASHFGLLFAYKYIITRTLKDLIKISYHRLLKVEK